MSPISTSSVPISGAGIKKPSQKKKPKNNGFKSKKASLALQKMHVFFKAHRSDDQCKDMTYEEQQKVLGKLWKASPENPKNSA